MFFRNILLLSLLGVLLTVNGQEKKVKDDDDKGEEYEHEEHSKLSVSRKNGKVSISSEQEDGNSETKYEFTFSVKGFPNLRLSFYNETESTEVKKTFRVGLMKLVEVEENSFDTPFNSTKVTHFGGSWTNWGPLTYTNVTTNGTSLLTFAINRTLSNGAFIKWETYVVNTATNIGNGLNLSTDSVKFSFTVKNYTYKSVGNAKLALVGQSFSAQTEENDDDDSEKVTMGDGAAFSWDNWVMVGERNVSLTQHKLNVTATSEVEADGHDASEDEDDEKKPGEKGALMAWTVEETNANEFFWDPVLSGSNKSQGIPVASSASAVASMALLVAASLVLVM